MRDRQTGVPAFFIALSTPRRLLALAALTLVSGAAMLPALKTMGDHGHSVIAFEEAGSVERSAAILETWGDAGKQAAWWQLAFDTPFLIGYGLFAAGACAAIARRAQATGKLGLWRVATVLVWFGPMAAAADFVQNVALALVLSGHVAQPWPRISALAAPLTMVLEDTALLFALVAWLATGGARRLRPRASASPGRR
jgi:hypothetical protein